MSSSVAAHRGTAPSHIPCAVVTVSDSRTPATDRGGDLLAELVVSAGHDVIARELIPDDSALLESALRRLSLQAGVDAILITGGTGISPRDQTYATVRQMLDSEIPGYGELFRMLSYAEIGAAAMLSRAVAGLLGQVVVATMPGSPAGIELAMQKLLLPELGHLVGEATRGRIREG